MLMDYAKQIHCVSMRNYRFHRRQIGFLMNKENRQNIEKQAHDDPMKHALDVAKNALNIHPEIISA